MGLTLGIDESRDQAAAPAVVVRRHRADIQGLRAFAVIVVILDHLTGWPAGGFAGVDMFFVISGFVITTLLLREHRATGRISFVSFYARRARRILPAAVLVLVATLAVAYPILNRSRFVDTVWDGVWSLFFGANWRFAATGTDYFTATGPISPLQHYWSLAVEEQFYVLWPSLLVVAFWWASRRRGARPERRAVLVAGGAVAAVTAGSLAWSLWETATNPVVAYFSSFSRGWELGVGAALAVAGPWLGRLPAALRHVLSVTGLAAMVLSVLWLTEASPIPAPAMLLPVLATAMVIAAGTGTDAFRGNPLLTNRVAGYLGDISYSLYLWHFPVVVLLGTVMVEGKRYYAVAGALILLLAVHGYHLVEDPIRKTGRLGATSRKARRRYAALSLSSVAFLVAAILTLPMVVRPETAVVVDRPPEAGESSELSPGEVALQREIDAGLRLTTFPETDPPLQDSEAWMPKEVYGADSCLNPPDFADTGVCTYGDGSKLAMVVGDSVAMSWVPAVRDALGKEGYRVHGVGISNCPFAAVTLTIENDPAGSEWCNSSKGAIEQQIRQLRPDLVIATDFEYNIIRQAIPDPDTMIRAWTKGLTRSIRMAQGYGAEVVILGPNPAGAALSECVTPVSTPAQCVLPIAGSWHQKQAAEQAAAAVTGARYVDSRKWFCNAADQCPLVLEDVAVRSDAVHLSGPYAAKIAGLIGDDLLGR